MKASRRDGPVALYHNGEEIMRRFLLGFSCLVAALLGNGTLRAADKHAEAHEPVKVKAHLHIHGADGKDKSEEKEFDLSKPEEKSALYAAIEKGEVDDLKKVKKLDLFGIKRWDLGIWSIIIFVVLFAVLGKFAWGPMIKGLQKREENIRSAQEQAEKARADAMALQGQLDAKMRSAGADIAKMMDEARGDAQAIKTQMVAEAKAEIQSDRDRVLREVATAKDQALQELWQKAVGLASAMSTKAVRRTLTDEDHRKLLDESLAELKQAGGEFGKRVH